MVPNKLLTFDLFVFGNGKVRSEKLGVLLFGDGEDSKFSLMERDGLFNPSTEQDGK